MSIDMRLCCDKCGADDLRVYTVATATDARVEGFREGWYYDGTDLCPVCSGRKPGYFDEEPF